MSSQTSALKRIITKSEHNKFNEIILNISDQVFIGRDIECNYRISSIEISRRHAVIKYTDNHWTISDLNSTNGLFVNSQQLKSYTPYRLSNGDKVCFGPPNQSEFNYQFIANYQQNNNNINNTNNCNNSVSYELSGINLTTIPVIPIVTHIQTDSTEQLLPSNTLRFNIEPNVSGTISLSTNMPTRSGLNYQISTVSTSRSPRMSVTTTNCGHNTSVSQHKRLSSRSKHSSANINASIGRIHAMNNFVEHDYSRSSAAILSNDEPVIERKSAHKSSRSSGNRNKSSPLKLKDKSKDSKVCELENKKIAKELEKLEKAKRDLEDRKESERLRIKQKEDLLKAKMKELDKKERETRKKEEQIQKLQKQLSQEKKVLMEEKSKQNVNCDENRKSSKRKLSDKNDCNTKSVESKRLCNDGTNNADKQSQIEEIFESEMTCSVCHEYFIHAVNLNCSHTFCFACIEQWKNANGGQNVCPMCRKDIENQNRELVLDNLIDRFVAKMKPHLLEHRLRLIEERKKKLEKQTNQSDSAANRRLNGGNRGLIPNIFPRLHFFLRETIQGSDTDSDQDSDDVNVIGFGYADSFASSSSEESDDSSSESSDSSDDDNSSDESNEQTSSDSSSDSSSQDSSHSEEEDIEESFNDSASYVSQVFASANRNNSDSDVESTYGAISDRSYYSDSNLSSDY